MRTILLLLTICALAIPAMAQEGLLQNVKGAAKSKLESQDFNSSRSNKEKRNLHEEKKSAAPAPESVPAPEADSTAGQPIAPHSDGSVNHKDSYTFDHYVKYEMSQTGSDKMSMACYYGENTTMVSMNSNPDMIMISDTENKVNIMLNEKDKTAIVQSSEMMDQAMANQSKSDVTVTKTGQKKQILGYTCEEYVMTGNQNKKYAVVWITTEIGLSHNTLENLSQRMVITGTNPIPENALVMEMIISENGTHMLVTEFQKATTIKSLQGYTVSTY